jgi:hypothetical protein
MYFIKLRIDKNSILLRNYFYEQLIVCKAIENWKLDMAPDAFAGVKNGRNEDWGPGGANELKRKEKLKSQL